LLHSIQFVKTAILFYKALWINISTDTTYKPSFGQICDGKHFLNWFDTDWPLLSGDANKDCGSEVPASYPGSQWAGKERAWYPLFAHALNLPEILVNWKLLCYIRITMTT